MESDVDLHETVFTHTFVECALHYRRQFPKEEMILWLYSSSRTFCRGILLGKLTSLSIVWAHRSSPQKLLHLHK